MYVKMLKNLELRVEYYQMPNIGPNFLSGTRFFKFCNADTGRKNAGGLNRLAAGQLVTLKQETD